MKKSVFSQSKIYLKVISTHIALLVLNLTINSFSGECQSKINPRALALNNKAAKIVFDSQGGKLDSAITYLDQAIKIQPDYFLARASKVKIYCKQKKYNDAVMEARHLITLQPTNPEAIFFLGVLLEKSGNVKEAKEKYEKAALLNKKKWDKLTRSDKNFSSLSINYALNLKFINKPGEARKLLEPILEKDPNNIAANLIINKSRDQLFKDTN